MEVFADRTGNQIRAEYSKMQETLRDPTIRKGDIVLPTWEPRMPLGIYSYGTAMAVRDVNNAPRLITVVSGVPMAANIAITSPSPNSRVPRSFNRQERSKRLPCHRLRWC